MHSFIKPLWIAGLACAGIAGASAQDASQATARQPLTSTMSTAQRIGTPTASEATPYKQAVTATTAHTGMATQLVRPNATAAVTDAAPPPQATAPADQPATDNLRLPAAAARAASKFHLDPSALHRGTVKAVTDGHAETVSPDTLAGQAKRGTVFVTHTSDKATRITLPASLGAALGHPAVGGASPSQAPALQLGYTLSTTAGAEGNPVRLVALIANNTGLVLDAARSAYRGGFSVALSNPDDPTDRRALNAPVTLAITATGASEVAPAPLDIADVGRWHTVTVTVPNVSGDTYHVAVSADPQDHGNAIDLPVSRPAIQIIAAQPEITGWGIGRTAITVRARGLVSPEGYPVTLRNEHGSLQPTYVTLDAQGMATASLRSDSAASTRISIGDAGVNAEPTTVTFSAPWLFLAAAVAGGLLGAFIRGKGRRHLWYALAIGVASAILMTLAYAVGIDWVSRLLSAPQLATSGEAVVFVLGAIAALAGVGVLLPTPTPDSTALL